MVPPKHHPFLASIGLLSLLMLSQTALGQASLQRDDRAELRPQSKQSVLHRLSELSSVHNSRWLVGQNAGHCSADIRAEYRKNVTRLHDVTGELPSLLGIDLGYNDVPRRQTSARKLVRQFCDQGGLVTVSMHPKSPFRNSDCHDVRPVDWNEIFVPGSIVQQRWQRTLDRAADFLGQLKDDGVVVLWRPLHEMNGGWFWWCARHSDDRWTSRAEFVSLWKHLHRHFAERGLDNVLWVYAPAVQTDSGQRSALDYYPGDKYVDVVGLDWYDDELENLDSFGSYRQLAQLGKPMGLTELGPLTQRDGTFDNLTAARAIQRYPRLGFALFWHSWPGADVAIVHNRNASELVNAEDALTLDFYRKSSSPTP